MADPHVLTGLIAKPAEIAGEKVPSCGDSPSLAGTIVPHGRDVHRRRDFRRHDLWPQVWGAEASREARTSRNVRLRR